ncbi:MAG: pseudaminic acid cytidylyltransferase [Lachnospiraceae bacterium]|nr:pseudaminic acid cytidylyltransferase [Lachnospiraceae bacterium]
MKIAIITARGGSKRIPRKNIKDFCGKPIIAYSIEAAVRSGVFDEVMVSTDDEEIAQIARQYGASIPFMRSEYTSGDYATTTDVLGEVLDEYRKKDRTFDMAACIYPTAPFITADKLRDAVNTLESSGADTLIPVVEFSYPIQRSMVIRDEMLSFAQEEYINTRSQDLEKHYHDAGQFYIFRPESFQRNLNLLKGNIIPLVLSEMEVQDIDTEIDWKLAELKYSLLKG